MITGYVNKELLPTVDIGLPAGSGVTTIPAIVDTGFSGYLCLADRHVDEVPMEYKYVERYELADGSVIVRDVFRARILFGRREREVDVIFTAAADTLIGAALMQGHELCVDYVRGTVKII